MATIDLRSDTVTHPTPEMRAAMAAAEVGDDVYGEDPTIRALEEKGAEKMGKEAGLFVPSGTMGNLTAILASCGRGDEMILGNTAHTFLYEAGGASALGGVHPYLLPTQPDGTLRLDDIQDAVRGDDVHFPVTRLVILENTHNRCGGVPLTREYTQKIGEFCKHNGLKLHLDGARIFNAAVSFRITAKELAAPADSVTFCLSKGLCAPVGSVLCGTTEFIRVARRVRKQLGGGMRQAGVLAAAGIVALDKMVDRLAEDHRRARQLAKKLETIPGIQLDAKTPPTNMIFFHLDEDIRLDAADVVTKLKEEFNILVGAVGPRRIRMVTHYWIDDEEVEKAALALSKVL